MDDLRSRARTIFDAGVAAADPYSAVKVVLDEVAHPASIVAVGKAARMST